ncbi:hypothetical protein CTI14_23755 [Methylobacterium radiotolerans]|nr:hypothetical protein CTI14_23755 [Methylobacterium radiotolerans]
MAVPNRRGLEGHEQAAGAEVAFRDAKGGFLVQGAGPRSSEEIAALEGKFRFTLRKQTFVIPPGTWRFRIVEGWRGMSRRPELRSRSGTLKGGSGSVARTVNSMSSQVRLSST